MDLAAISGDDGRLAAPDRLIHGGDAVGVDGALMLALAIDGGEAQGVELDTEFFLVEQAEAFAEQFCGAVDLGERRCRGECRGGGFSKDIRHRTAIGGDGGGKDDAAGLRDTRGFQRVEHAGGIDRDAEHDLLRHGDGEEAGQGENTVHALRRVDDLVETKDVAAQTLHARLVFEMRDGFRCAEGKIIEQADLPGTAGEQPIRDM